MSYSLKVRDRTTNKVREALVDQETYERLKGYTYLTDKNSKEPFREIIKGDKRPRVALKRDVMSFDHGDPRRVCYVDKGNVFDCRKSNLKTRADDVKTKTTEEKPKKMVKIMKVKVGRTAEVKPVATVTATVHAPVVTAAIPTPTPVAKVASVTDLSFKRELLSKINPDKIIELVSMDSLLAAWAEANGYEKKHA